MNDKLSTIYSDRKENIGIILIAAGNSSRLGHMKQLIKIDQLTLIEKNRILAQKLSPHSVVILGYKHKKLEAKLSDCNCLYNEKWPIGMGTSIALGVNHFSENLEGIDGVMIMQCDQYRLTFEDYSNLINVWKNTDKGIVASQYNQTTNKEPPNLKSNSKINTNKLTLGAPAIFSKLYYDELILLKEKGAKALLTKYSRDLEAVKINNGAYDIDTPADYDVFNQYQNMPSPQPFATPLFLGAPRGRGSYPTKLKT